MKKELAKHIQMEEYFLKMYKEAEKAEDKETMELIRNKHIAMEEEIKENGDGYCWMYRTMRNAAKRGNELPDFPDSVWEKDIPMYVEAMKDAEFTQFTISSTMSGMTGVISAFIENGCELKGMTTVRSNYEEFVVRDGKTAYERKDIPAFLLEIK